MRLSSNWLKPLAKVVMRLQSVWPRIVGMAIWTSKVTMSVGYMIPLKSTSHLSNLVTKPLRDISNWSKNRCDSLRLLHHGFCDYLATFIFLCDSCATVSCVSCLFQKIAVILLSLSETKDGFRSPAWRSFPLRQTHLPVSIKLTWVRYNFRRDKVASIAQTPGLEMVSLGNTSKQPTQQMCCIGN